MQLRELLEERAQQQSDLGDLDAQVQELQQRANAATYLQSEVCIISRFRSRFLILIQILSFQMYWLAQLP